MKNDTFIKIDDHIIGKDDILRTREKIAKYIHNTPVLKSSMINDICNNKVFFKCENFQKVGAFKMRGAMNAVLNLTDEQKERGVITHSSGNFAQALSLASSYLGIKAYIVMPENTPKIKKNAVMEYNGNIIESGNTIKEREEKADEIIKKTNATFIHPYNDINVILGQATCAFELLSEYPDLDFIFAPIGGGGLISGTCLSSFFFSDICRIIGGEPFEADDAYRSLKSGKIEINKTINTIADGLRTNLGDITFPIMKRFLSHIERVHENEIIDNMRLIWERMKIIIEPSSAVAFAALRKFISNNDYYNLNIGVILSGGNVDLNNLPF